MDRSHVPLRVCANESHINCRAAMHHRTVASLQPLFKNHQHTGRRCQDAAVLSIDNVRDGARCRRKQRARLIDE